MDKGKHGKSIIIAALTISLVVSVSWLLYNAYSSTTNPDVYSMDFVDPLGRVTFRPASVSVTLQVYYGGAWHNDTVVTTGAMLTESYLASLKADPAKLATRFVACFSVTDAGTDPTYYGDGIARVLYMRKVEIKTGQANHGLCYQTPASNRLSFINIGNGTVYQWVYTNGSLYAYGHIGLVFKYAVNTHANFSMGIYLDSDAGHENEAWVGYDDPTTGKKVEPHIVLTANDTIDYSILTSNGYDFEDITGSTTTISANPGNLYASQSPHVDSCLWSDLAIAAKTVAFNKAELDWNGHHMSRL